MNEYPLQYYEYSPYQYQTLQVQGIIGVIMMVAMGAWALSLVKKAFKGEEVRFPL